MASAHLHLRPDPALSLKDPESTGLGLRVLEEGLGLMNELGLEAFTFRKLADRMGSTEVTLYKYFPNKQRLLQYYYQLYWLWLRQVCGRIAERAHDPREALEDIVEAICGVWPRPLPPLQLDPHALRRLVIEEGMKSYLHKNVDDDNARRLFLPYKELSAFMAERLVACRADVPWPRSFATTVIEMAHSLPFAMEHLPSLTELSSRKDLKQLAQHLLHRTITYLDHAQPLKKR
ncbi:MAG: TetR/AcrR family transcriptional regulator [Flavobacteriales bacterium]|nr:TetR/AcrR family transcriptional regulator [Flavobacteriales bacterium]